MSTKINDSMSLEIDGHVIATAEFREHAAANGHGAWIVSCHPGRLFTRNQAITAMVLAGRLAAGFGDDDSFVRRGHRGHGWRQPGARRRARPGRRTGQRMARPGAGRLI